MTLSSGEGFEEDLRTGCVIFLRFLVACDLETGCLIMCLLTFPQLDLEFHCTCNLLKITVSDDRLCTFDIACCTYN